METRVEEATDVNSVRLVGRISAVPEQRTLPSGDELCVCRISVTRDKVRVLPSGRRSSSVDLVDLAAWSARTRRTMARWRPGDEVEVEGALRRRFYRAGERTMSRVEVEVSSCRTVRRAAT